MFPCADTWVKNKNTIDGGWKELRPGAERQETPQHLVVHEEIEEQHRDAGLGRLSQTKARQTREELIRVG